MRCVVAVCVGLGFLVASAISAQDSRCPTASKFGPDDQVGNLRYVTPAKTLAAAKLVTRGKAYRLAIETNRDTPAYPPRTWSITVVQPNQLAGATLGPAKLSYNDDIIHGWVGIGSQIDGLGHLGIDNLYYNCNRSTDFAKVDGLKKLGIENVPAIATRGVLLDMAGYLGIDIVPEGTVFRRAEIEGAMKRQAVAALEKGDVVLFHTGWSKLLGRDNARFAAGEPGLGREAASYLAAAEVSMIGADTWGVEVVPFEEGAGPWEVHQVLIPLHGIHILENMSTEAMVRDQAWEFLFTLGPARITGAVQAIVNPIAIK